MESDSDVSLSKADFALYVQKAFQGVTLKHLELIRATLSGEMEVLDKAGAIGVEVRIETAKIPFPLESHLVATGDAGTPDSCTRMVEKALSDAAQASRELVRIASGGEPEWRSALTSPEPDIQVLGARLLGRHKVAGALEPLAALLEDPREPVVEAAADALKHIGDVRAVPKLIQSIRRGDVRSEVRVIEAIGRIGGKEAEAYLEMTAIGHEIPEVRRLSADLLAQLRKEKKRP